MVQVDRGRSRHPNRDGGTPVNGPEKTLIWRVPGMATPADVESVRRIVNGLHDVEVIAVDLPARLITVEYDPDAADPAEITAFLATAGYPVERP